MRWLALMYVWCAILVAGIFWRRKRAQDLLAYRRHSRTVDRTLACNRTAFTECWGGPWCGELRPVGLLDGDVIMNIYSLEGGRYSGVWRPERLNTPSKGWVYGWRQHVTARVTGSSV